MCTLHVKMTANIDIVVVGCINSDLVSFVSRLPSAGETVFSSALESHFGGKGANQAAQAALLRQSSTNAKVTHECAFGTSQQASDISSLENGTAANGLNTSTCGVAMVGRVGRDTAGLSFLRHFHSLGIDTRGITIDPQAGTGTALVTVANGGENTIAYMPGANALLNKEHISAEPVLSLLGGAKVIVSENGVPGSASVECFRIAKKANANVLTVFTPAPVDCVDPEICCFTDFLLCNSVEAKALVKAWDAEAAVTEADDEAHIARRLHEVMLRTASRFPEGVRGRANVVITCGAHPCVIFASGSAVKVPIAKHVPSEHVVDTTGAGDSFAGSFAHFLLQTPNSPETAVAKATFVAAHSVTKKGAAESYAGRCELPDHLFQPS
ncbi:ribokinase, putative [Eimeria praecox]|uniref:Ribokinase n=1 Tax=Eimeria praecox TaxID=51316 RepID=U6H4H0_9EIME|nr:ribokinase, putative [Eimeria praecox]